ncbi:hypothetical protein [Streptomyces sp. NPDC000961]|uniref:hypothetical protein n=1 Tax=Streptomyces sp. NPDC000961 TaxID=3364541 RepID=UPI0036C4902B
MRTVPETGRWEVVLETRDRAELRAFLDRLREARIDGSLIRVDTLCRRPVEQSGYRVSRFMAHTAREPDREPADH